MKNLVKFALFGLLACSFAPQSAHATLIQAGWFFDANDDADVETLSQTVTAAGGNITFDFDVTMSSTAGTVVDTSNVTGPANQMFGIGIDAGGNITTGESIDFTVSISNIVQNGPHRISLQDLSFRFLGTEAGNGVASGGTLTTPSGSSGSTWVDANGPAPPGTTFNGHLPGTTSFGTGSTEGFFFQRSVGVQQTGNFDVQSGFDIPRTEITNGGAFGTNVTSFTHATDMGTYRLNDIVVQIRATPEPSSMLLGLVAALLGMMRMGWRRTLEFVGLRKETNLLTS